MTEGTFEVGDEQICCKDVVTVPEEDKLIDNLIEYVDKNRTKSKAEQLKADRTPIH